MTADTRMKPRTDLTPEDYERRAPGWQIRCLRCGLTEPWGKYGLRLGACGRSYTLGRCTRCGRIRFHVIEKEESPSDASRFKKAG